jgi:hypothetical protein
LALVQRILLIGPDPPASNGSDGNGLAAAGAFSVPWWSRLALVATGLGAGWLWSDTGLGQQLAWGLDYGALVGVSLAASHWKLLLGVNLGLALLWAVLPLRPPETSPRLWWVSHAVTFVNRQLGHLEALATWVTLAVVTWPRLVVQLPFVAAVLLLGPPVINGLARRTSLGQPGPSRADGSLNWARRPIIYAFTVLGLTALALRAPHQVRKLAPVLVAILLGGVLPRMVQHLLHNRQVKEEAGDPGRVALRRSYRLVQMGAVHLDNLVAAAMVLGMVGVLVTAWLARRQYDAALQAAAALPANERAGVCVRDPGGPTRAEVSVFIASDSQFHELQGQRFPGQVELADAFVPVALRPVELDLLSAATLWRFGTVYAKLAAGAAATGATLLWAHLGDFADLACEGELGRLPPFLDHFAAGGKLAGVAPGNHDKSFTGNFFWSPFWDSACRRRLEKQDSDALITRLVSDRLTAGAAMSGVDGGFNLSGLVTGRGTALVTVSPLGVVHHQGAARGLVGIFMDTADERAFDLGVAGLFGTFSEEQARTIVGLVRALQASERGPYADPVYLLFGHHPLDEMTGDARGRIEELITRLDGGPDPGAVKLPPSGGEEEEELARDQPPRVLALITAHTHQARASYHCVRRRRYLRELVVGSTIDPPQEAALLTVGADADGLASLRLRTLPAVSREDKTCGPEPAVTALECQRTMARLEREPDCRPLFQPADRLLAPDCQELERPMTLSQRLEALSRSQGPTSPAGIKAAQVVRTRHLLSCLCRGGSCQPPPGAMDLTDDEQYVAFLVERLRAGSAARPREQWEQELTCLSWAASAIQQHKAAGMGMADALRCAFDDGTLAAAKDYVATLKRGECR